MTTPTTSTSQASRPLRMTANGQHVLVKRLTDTYFISLDIRHGASVHDLYHRTAYAMAVDVENLRLCLQKPDGQVDFLPASDDVVLKKAPYSFKACGQPVVYAILRIHGEWEQPCTVDYPSTSTCTSTCTNDENADVVPTTAANK